MDNIADEQLIDNYLKGDEKSLEILVARYLKPIYFFLFRYIGNAGDAEDAAQEVFLKMWKNIKKFDRQKKFKTWLYSIAKNTAIDFLRKKKGLTFSQFEDDEGVNILSETLADPAPLPDDLLASADAGRLLMSAIEKLDLKYRSVILLHYSEQLTFTEIAESSGEPLDTVKSRHRRAINKLRDLLIDSASLS